MKTEIPIEQRYGYHIIDTPELKRWFSPKLETDEYLLHGWWHAADTDWQFELGSIYRRRINPGEGFRFVGLDEVILDGDEFSTYEGKWLRSGVCGTDKVRTSLTSRVLCYRRKVATPSIHQFGWVKCSEAVPKDDRSYLSQRENGTLHTFSGEVIRDSFRHGVVQWLNYPNPEPVKSIEKVAYEKWLNSQKAIVGLEESWMAALEWDRSKK